MTTNTSAVFPAIVAPDWVIELEAITSMNCGTVAGGFELLPGPLVQRSPHLGGLLGTLVAKPLKLAGGDPEPRLFSDGHRAPQKVTLRPTVASWSPITNDPCASAVAEVIDTCVLPWLGVCAASPP